MPSNSPLRASSPPPPSRSSFLSRIKSPFGSKARNNLEFEIQPDDPLRQYSAGDLVTGCVVLKVFKPMRITHMVISLHGHVQVYKNPNQPGDGWRAYAGALGSGKGKKSGGYFGNGFASLFEDEKTLCGDGRLGEGIYHFQFELEFPKKRLPSSIDVSVPTSETIVCMKRS
jgi:arrestin-related trafficking adapter 9